MQAGELYAIDLAKVWPKVDRALEGKYVLAWCVGAADSSGFASPTPYMTFVVADGFVESLPKKLPHDLTPRVLVHRSPNVTAIHSVPDEAPPKGVTLIGKLDKLPRVHGETVFGYWAAIVMDVHYSWQRQHESPPKPTKEVRKPKPLDPRKLLSGWSGVHAKALRALLREAIARKPTKAGMRKLVEAINDYNDANGSFIDTAEREALMEALESIAAAHDLGMLTKQLDSWRDW